MRVRRPRELCAPAAAGTDARFDAATHRRDYDEAACTATGPGGCPQLRGVTTSDAASAVTVHRCVGGCTSGARADCVLSAAVGAEDAIPTLVADDAPVP